MFTDSITVTDGTANHVYESKGRINVGPGKYRHERSTSNALDDTPENLLMQADESSNALRWSARFSLAEKDSVSGKIGVGYVQITVGGVKGINTAAALKALIRQARELLAASGNDDKIVNGNT